MALTAFLAIFAWAFHSTEAVVAVIAGGVIALVNFLIFSSILKKLFFPERDPLLTKGLAYVSFIIRYAVLGFILLVVIKSGIQPVFLLIGLSAVTLAVFFSYKEIKKGNV